MKLILKPFPCFHGNVLRVVYALFINSVDSDFLYHHIRTLRQHCPATIKLGLSQDCQQLVVTNMNETHNQAMSIAPARSIAPAPSTAPATAPTEPDMLQLKMPPVMRKRGHPKGAELTAIGLPKRRRRDGP